MTTQISGMRKMRHSQQGVVLIVGLIMVLMMSIIAVAAIKGSGLQEAMAGSMRGRNLGFQSAESAISLAESTINTSTVPIDCVDGANGSSIVCWHDLELNSHPGNSVTYYDDAAIALNGNLTTLGLTYVSSQPIYILEELLPYKRVSDGNEMSESQASNALEILPYRITAKGVGVSADSSVIVQSTYNRSAD